MLKSTNLLHKWGLSDSDMNSTVANAFPFPQIIRSKEYRTPPVVAPPQVPSNYAPNYPMQQQQQYQKGLGKQYGTLPHPQVF